MLGELLCPRPVLDFLGYVPLGGAERVQGASGPAVRLGEAACRAGLVVGSGDGPAGDGLGEQVRQSAGEPGIAGGPVVGAGSGDLRSQPAGRGSAVVVPNSTSSIVSPRTAPAGRGSIADMPTAAEPAMKLRRRTVLAPPSIAARLNPSPSFMRGCQAEHVFRFVIQPGEATQLDHVPSRMATASNRDTDDV